MTSENFMKIKSNRIKEMNIDEKMIQEIFANNPSILGLGDLSLVDKEQYLQSGRVDLVFENKEDTLYITEVQLGKTDSDHIVRTIMYWNEVQIKNRDKSCIAVLVAEGITDKLRTFLDLLHKSVPVIILNMQCVVFSDDKFSIVCTKIFDSTDLFEENQQSDILIDRAYWENKSSPAMLRVVDKIFEFIKIAVPNVTPNFKKEHIGILLNSSASTKVEIRPVKTSVSFKPRIDETNEQAKLLLKDWNYTREDSHNRYVIPMNADNVDSYKDLIIGLTKIAFEN